MIEYKEPNAYDVIQRDVETSFYKHINKSPEDIKTICIVGAYHGYEIQRLLRLYPNCHIHAIEAHPKHYDVLLNNYKSNPRVTLYQKAISNTIGTINFYELNIEGSGSILKFQYGDLCNHAKIVEEIYVDTTTLNELFEDMSFDLMWIDVQGAELLVLQGGTPANYAALFMEIHTPDYIKPWDNEPYLGQCHKSDLENYLVDSHFIHSIGLDNENGNGQGNSFWLRNDFKTNN